MSDRYPTPGAAEVPSSEEIRKRFGYLATSFDPEQIEEDMLRGKAAERMEQTSDDYPVFAKPETSRAYDGSRKTEPVFNFQDQDKPSIFPNTITFGTVRKGAIVEQSILVADSDAASERVNLSNSSYPWFRAYLVPRTDGDTSQQIQVVVNTNELNPGTYYGCLEVTIGACIEMVSVSITISDTAPKSVQSAPASTHRTAGTGNSLFFGTILPGTLIVCELVLLVTELVIFY